MRTSAFSLSANSEIAFSFGSFALQVTKEPSYRKSPVGSFVGIVLESFGFWLERPQVRDSIRDQLSLELQKLAFDKFWFVDAIQIFILICKIFQVHKINLVNGHYLKYRLVRYSSSLHSHMID